MEHHHDNHEREREQRSFPDMEAKRFLMDDDPRYSLTPDQLEMIENDATFRKFNKRYNQSARRLEKEGKLYDIARNLIANYIQNWKLQRGIK